MRVKDLKLFKKNCRAKSIRKCNKKESIIGEVEVNINKYMNNDSDKAQRKQNAIACKHVSNGTFIQ